MSKKLAICIMVFSFFFTIPFIKAANVSGKVLDAKNKPIPGVEILVEHLENRNSESPDSFVLRAEPDKDGYFNISIPEPEGKYELLITDGKGRILCGFAHVGSKSESNLGTIIIEKNCEVTGIVRDKDGKVLKDTNVVAQIKTRNKCSHYVDVADTQTKTDGTFELKDLVADKYVFLIFSKGLAFAEVESELVEGVNRLEVRLDDDMATLSGTVTDEDDKPIQGAKVSAGKKILKAVTDAEGKYSIGGLKPGTYDLKFAAKGFAVPGNRIPEVECKEIKEYNKNIKLARTGSLMLDLATEGDSFKIPEKISVEFNPRDGGSGRFKGRNIYSEVKEGKALFLDLAPGKFELQINGKGAAEVRESIEIQSGKEAELKIKLSKGYELSGKIVDESGTPIGGLFVTVCKLQNEAGSSVSMVSEDANDDGTFSIGGLNSGKYEFQIKGESSIVRYTGEANVGNDSSQPLTIVIKKGLCIAGKVVESDGTPAKKVKMRLTKTSGKAKWGIYFSVTRVVSEDGSFKVEGLEPGKYNITIMDSILDYELASIEKVDAGSEEIIIPLGKMLTVSGVVIDNSGNTIGNVGVSVASDDVGRRNLGLYDNLKTDKDGIFKLNLRESAKKYFLCFSHWEFLAKILDFEQVPNKDTLKITLEKGCTVRGTVIKGKDKSPVKRMIVQTEEFRNNLYPGSGNDEDKHIAKTGADGKFILEMLPPGTVTFSVFPEKSRRPIFSKSEVVKRDQKNEIIIELPEMVSFKGKVIDEKGEPIPNASISTMLKIIGAGFRSSESSGSASSDNNGCFTIDFLRIGGSYDITAEKDGYCDLTRSFIIKDEIKDGTVFTLAKGLSICGIVRTSDGKPLDGAIMKLFPARDENTDQGTDGNTPVAIRFSKDGKFKFDCQKPGEYDISARESFFDNEFEIGVANKIEAGSGNLVITVGKSQQISGRVLDVSGAPIPDVSIYVLPRVSKSHPYLISCEDKTECLKTDKNGGFKFDFRKDLDAILEFSHPSYIAKKIELGLKTDRENLKITMDKGYIVTGKVVREKDKSPVEGVLIQYHKSDDFLEYLITCYDNESNVKKSNIKTDKDGMFRLEAVPDGTLIIPVHSDTSNKLLCLKELYVSKKDNNDVVIELPEPASFTGKVLDVEGNPIPEARVAIGLELIGENFHVCMSAGSVIADDQGAFKYADAIPGKYTFSFTSPEHFPSGDYITGQTLEIKSGETKEVVLRQKRRLAGSVKINGKVPDADIIQFIPVKQSNTQESSFYNFRFNLDSEGKFEFDQMEPGIYFFTLLKSNPDAFKFKSSQEKNTGNFSSALSRKISGTFEVKDAMKTLDIDLKCFSVYGSVSLPGAKHAYNSTVTILPAIDGLDKTQEFMFEVSAKVKGYKFRIDLVPEGKYRLVADRKHAGVFSKEITVSGEDLSVNIDLPEEDK